MVKIIATNVWMYRENEFQWRLARVGQIVGRTVNVLTRI